MSLGVESLVKGVEELAESVGAGATEEAVETIAGGAAESVAEKTVEKAAETLTPEALAEKLDPEVKLLTANAGSFGEGLLEQASQAEGIPQGEMDDVLGALKTEDAHLLDAEKTYRETV